MTYPSEAADETQSGAFPTAIVVVGIGKMGDRILHQLGERWSWIATDNPHDQTLSHLSLIHLDESALAGEPAWERAEAFEAFLAREEGDASGPDRALDLLVLRTLGLVRFVDGEYQIALPVDEGPLSLLPNGFPAASARELRPRDGAASEEPEEAERSDEGLSTEAGSGDRETHRSERAQAESQEDELELNDLGHGRLLDAIALYTGAAARQGPQPQAAPADKRNGAQRNRRADHREGLFARHTTFRRRSYRWLRLAEDPLDAADALAELLQVNGSLARFIEPILARVRDGNSPKILLSLLRRLKSWEQGRDPSPWRWLLGNGSSDPPSSELLDAYARALFDRAGRGNFTPPNGRHEFFHTDDPRNVAPLEPWLLLSLDWQTPGWTFPANGLDQRVFRTLPAHPHDFGFYDEDTRGARNELRFDLDKVYKHLAARQIKLARLAQRGLLRLWAQLTRIRLGSRSEEDSDGEFNETRLEALHQSLAILGELLVRDIAQETAEMATMVGETSGALRSRAPDAEGASPAPGLRHDARGHASASEVEQLNDVWCAALRRRDRTNFMRLVERLDRLGIHAGETDAEPFQLYHRVGLEIDADALAPQDAATALRLSEATERKIRHLINQRARSLLSAAQLSKLPRPPGQMPLYIRVFIVGDMGEKAVRLFSQPVLRLVHAELFRVARPIYEGRFDGHTRPLAIVPFFSMPHPADAAIDEAGDGRRARAKARTSDEFSRYESERRRITERLVIDAVHHLRRSVELIPSAERLTFELLVSGRITDRSVMTIDDSIDEIRSFIWMNARNSLADDPELTTLLSNRGSDLLSTVSCRELSFPVERARAWAANRFERSLLRVFTEKPADATAVEVSAMPESLELPSALSPNGAERGSLPAPLEQPFRKIEDRGAELLQRISNDIPEKLKITFRDDASVFLEERANDEAINQLIYKPIEETWRELAQTRGVVDDDIPELRRHLAAKAVAARQRIEQTTEAIVADECARKGSLYALAHVDVMEDAARQYLRKAAEAADEAEQLVAQHPRPEPQRIIEGAVENFKQKVAEKPDFIPFVFFGVSTAFALALILGPRLIAYLAQLPIPGISNILNVQHPGWLMSRGMEFAIGVLILGAGAFALFFYFRKSIKKIDEARDDLTRAVKHAIGSVDGERAAANHALLPFFTKRLNHRWELARKTHALYVWESSRHDAVLARRLEIAASVRTDALRLAAEKLGVKAQPNEGGADHDQIDKLFDTELGADAQWLVGTRVLERWYRDETKSGYTREIEEDSELARQQLIEYFELHPLLDWRRAVPFGDATLEAFCREHWSALVDEAVISQQPIFRDAAGAALRKFAASHFGTLGYGAQFRGYEGMDDDGIDARELLVVLPSTLRHELEDALEEGDDDLETKTRKRVIRQIPKTFADIRPNAAYLLMTAMGIRERSFQNLRRFISFHDRRGLIERERFPLSAKGFASAAPSDRPLNPFLYTSIDDPKERASTESESER